MLRSRDTHRPELSTTVHRAHRVATVLVTVALITALGAPAGAASNPREQREEARRKRVAVTAEVDVLAGNAASVEQAIDELEAVARVQEATLADARRAADDAERRLVEARAAEAATVERLAVLRTAMSALAVKVYMRPPAADALTVLQSGSLEDITQRPVLLDVRTDSYATLGDELEAARDDLTSARAVAEEATARAVRQREEAAAQLASVEQAQAERERMAAQLEDRLDARLAEAASLAALDQQLSQQIAAEEAALAARLAKERAAAAAAAQAAAAKAAAAPVTARNSAAPPPRSTSPAPAAPGREADGATVEARVGGLASVGGITVSADIAEKLEAMLNAAAADGVVLRGGGFRDPAGQIAVRRSNCGTSDYALYSMPASQCSPPTARPGSSMHEQGLAVDFTYNGSIISSRGSEAFSWLAANAARFGFFNLPSEPWHWSTNGR